MRALVFAYITEEVAYAQAQNAPLSVALLNTWARSHAQGTERDLLVVYLVIDICETI